MNLPADRGRVGFFPALDRVVDDQQISRHPRALADASDPHAAALVRLPSLFTGSTRVKGAA